MSHRYRENLKRRILSGTAPHMELLLHQCAFGKPRNLVELPPSPKSTGGDVMALMPEDERRQVIDIPRRAQKRFDAGSGRCRLVSTQVSAPRPVKPRNTRGGR